MKMNVMRGCFCAVCACMLTGCGSTKDLKKANLLLDQLKGNDCAIVKAGITAVNPEAGLAISTLDPDCKVGRAYLDFIQSELNKLQK